MLHGFLKNEIFELKFFKNAVLDLKTFWIPVFWIMVVKHTGTIVTGCYPFTLRIFGPDQELRQKR